MRDDDRLICLPTFFIRRKLGEEETPQPEKKPYQAATIQDCQVKWLRFQLDDGTVHLRPYASIQSIRSATASNLTLIFADGGLFLAGQNLRLLLPDLQDERIRAFGPPFDLNRHRRPDDSAAIIYRVSWGSNEELIREGKQRAVRHRAIVDLCACYGPMKAGELAQRLQNEQGITATVKTVSADCDALMHSGRLFCANGKWAAPHPAPDSSVY